MPAVVTPLQERILIPVSLLNVVILKLGHVYEQAAG
jgi:hypothetical protein